MAAWCTYIEHIECCFLIDLLEKSYDIVLLWEESLKDGKRHLDMMPCRTIVVLHLWVIFLILVLVGWGWPAVWVWRWGVASSTNLVALIALFFNCLILHGRVLLTFFFPREEIDVVCSFSALIHFLWRISSSNRLWKDILLITTGPISNCVKCTGVSQRGNFLANSIASEGLFSLMNYCWSV